MVVTRRDHQARERLRRGSGGRLGAEATLARTVPVPVPVPVLGITVSRWSSGTPDPTPPTFPGLRPPAFGKAPHLRPSAVLESCRGSETVVQTGGRWKRVHVRPGSLAPRHTVVPWTSGKKIPTLLVMVKYFRIV